MRYRQTLFITAYILVSGFTALAAHSLNGNKDIAFGSWLIGGVALTSFLVVTGVRRARNDSTAKLLAVGAGLALGLISAFVSFVVIVNVFERLGLGH